MRFLLVGITNSSFELYHIAYIKENEDKIVQIRRKNQKSIQLFCTKLRSCQAVLNIAFTSPIKTMKNCSSYVLVSETTNEMIVGVTNCEKLFHDYTKICININCMCSFVKHTDNSLPTQSYFSFHFVHFRFNWVDLSNQT